MKIRKHMSLVGCILLSFSVIIVFLLYCYNNIIDTSNRSYLFPRTTLALSSGWTLTDSKGDSQEISLPAKLDYGSYSLKRVIDSNFNITDTPVLCIMSDHMDLTVYLDGMKIYDFTNTSEKGVHSTGVTGHLVHLPGNYSGKELIIRLSTQIDSLYGYKFSVPVIGAKSAIIYKTFSSDILSFIISAILLIFGVYSFFVFLFVKTNKKSDRRFYHMANFSFLFAFYTLSTTFLTCFIFRNANINYICMYMVMAILPIPMMGIHRSFIDDKYQKLLTISMVLSFVNFYSQSILDYTDTFAFRDMLPITVFLVCISTILLSIALIKSKINCIYSNKLILISTIPMALGAIVDFYLIFNGNMNYVETFFFLIGVVIFISFRLIDFLRSYDELNRKSFEDEAFRDLAFTDLLTGLDNRNAYEECFKEIDSSLTKFSINKHMDIYCLMSDINNLKEVNDVYGHHAGDKLIIEAGRLLNECIGDSGRMFRIGGDEYVAFFPDFNEILMKECLDCIYEALKQFNKNNIPPIQLALGTDHYRPELDEDLSDLVRRTDHLMYQNKYYIKKRSHIYN